MLERLYKLLKKKPRRVEFDCFEVEPDSVEGGLVRSFCLPRQRVVHEPQIKRPRHKKPQR